MTEQINHGDQVETFCLTSLLEMMLVDTLYLPTSVKLTQTLERQQT